VPLNLADLATSVLAAPCPVVMIDACAILDIVRAASPSRETPSSVIVSAKRLENAAQAMPRRVWLIVTSTVRVEVDDNLASTVRELQHALQGFEKHLERIESAAESIIPLYRSSGPQQEAQRARLSDELRARVASLLDACHTLDDGDPSSLARARDRSIAKRPPAHKKESRKDCEMLEHYLALTASLRAGGMTHQKVLFVTSNKVDFDLGAEKAALRDELTLTGLTLLPTLDNAWGILGLPS
jgi:hypothetical protein